MTDHYSIASNIKATQDLELCLNWLSNKAGVSRITSASVYLGQADVQLREGDFEKAADICPGVVCRNPHGEHDRLYVDGVCGCRVFTLTEKRTALLVVKEAA